MIVGWYGFNPGSQLAFVGAGNVAAVMKIAVNTTLAGCAGGLVDVPEFGGCSGSGFDDVSEREFWRVWWRLPPIVTACIIMNR